MIGQARSFLYYRRPPRRMLYYCCVPKAIFSNCCLTKAGSLLLLSAKTDSWLLMSAKEDSLLQLQGIFFITAVRQKEFFTTDSNIVDGIFAKLGPKTPSKSAGRVLRTRGSGRWPGQRSHLTPPRGGGRGAGGCETPCLPQNLKMVSCWVPEGSQARNY